MGPWNCARARFAAGFCGLLCRLSVAKRNLRSPRACLPVRFLGEWFIVTLSVTLRASANDFADERDMRFDGGTTVGCLKE